MDGSQFDAWTRRRFGMATGGAAAAALLGLMGLADVDANHKNKHDGNSNKNKNKNNNNKKKCRKTGQSCDQTQKKKKCCNKNELCAQVQGQGSGTRCCKQHNQGCKNDSDCCGNDRCDNRKCRLP
jgi:hypothetical protein